MCIVYIIYNMHIMCLILAAIDQGCERRPAGRCAHFSGSSFSDQQSSSKSMRSSLKRGFSRAFGAIPPPSATDMSWNPILPPAFPWGCMGGGSIGPHKSECCYEPASQRSAASQRNLKSGSWMVLWDFVSHTPKRRGSSLYLLCQTGWLLGPLHILYRSLKYIHKNLQEGWCWFREPQRQLGRSNP